MQRYRETKAVKYKDLDAADDIDPITREITRNTVVIGVLAGNPSDYSQIKIDLAHITAVRGMLGRAVADLAEIWDNETDQTAQVKALLFNRILIEMKNGQRGGKNSDEAIWTQVRLENEYQTAKTRENKAKKFYYRFLNLRADLENLENSLKKILDHARDQ